MTARRVSRGVADVLQELELRRPTVVTGKLLTEILSATGSHLTPTEAAARLVRDGWLAPLRSRDAWEFVPAARAGRFPSGDPWIELRALLAHRPNAPVAVAFASSVWELGFASHQPTRPTVAHRQGWRPPRSLGDTRTVSYDWHLPTWSKTGLPVWQPATLAVAVAHRPDCQDNWANADDWLPEILQATTLDDVVAEAAGRPTATLARLGYLAERSGRHDIAAEVRSLLPEQLPVSYFGRRRPRGRWINRWKLYDAVLPAR